MLEKIIALRHQWLADAREIIQTPKVRDNLELFLQNAGDIFRYNVELGLIAWRGGENPKPYFVEAVDDLSDFCQALVDRGDSIARLPLGAACLVASLIGRGFAFALDGEPGEAEDLHLDRLLAAEIRGEAANGAQEGIARLGAVKRQALAARSYKGYFEILKAGPNAAGLAALVSSADGAYAARAKDSFFSGGNAIDGGGRYNDLVVDYRLGAILKHLGHESPSMHAWKW
ncbi:hypothetical protein [Caulobacter endophyticus]|uniref:hypothetical protein n=1 Tax=Caulobacter endophyticus TaxID=2172652 RepID=UPI0024101EC1|nr:hypothetical protein [Caulobacter endophyticus]MDG2530216.1 hypothetical protein [Caulobacter endophyticus]